MVWTYHNHFHEQQKIKGRTVLDWMIELTDPDCVGFDWDVYWGVRGLVDPVENIKKLGQEIKRFHCKDFPFSRLDHINMAKDLPEELVSWDNRDKFSAYKMVAPRTLRNVAGGSSSGRRSSIRPTSLKYPICSSSRTIATARTHLTA